MNERGPLLICSRPFPPKLGGSAILSRNLWGAWPAEDLVVLSQMDQSLKSDPSTVLPNVQMNYVKLWLSRYPRLRAWNDPLMAFPVRNALLTLAQQIRPRAIWANWPSTGFLLGAWLAARKLRLPLYVHMHDTWRESYNGFPMSLNHLAPCLFEQKILQDAKRVFAITDTAADHFRKKYGVDSYVLKHCLPDADINTSQPLTNDLIKTVIHFAGSIYPLMNRDAMNNLVKALDLCQSDISLDGYTFNPQGIRASGIDGPRVSLRFAPKAEVMDAQRKSAILFLPLAFRSPNPAEIRTVFPTKLLEYFVSGRPILVHAPADSWVSRAARRDGWGEVVDQPDPQILAATIDSLLVNKDKQHALVAAARREAQNRLASNVSKGLQQELMRLESSGK